MVISIQCTEIGPVFFTNVFQNILFIYYANNNNKFHTRFALRILLYVVIMMKVYTSQADTMFQYGCV